MRDRGSLPGGEPLSLPSIAEVEHADWPGLQRMCADLELNPKGRSGVVRMRVLDHVRRRARREVWRPAPEHVAALLGRLGFPEPAARIWENVIRLDAPAPWVGYGAARLAAGDVDEATKAFDRAAQMRDAAAHLHRAEALGARGDLLGAIGACDAYLAGTPDDLRALGLRAGFLARGGWLDEAIGAMQAATAAHPDASDAWRGLGATLLKAGRGKAAVDALRRALKLDDADVDAWLNLGTALLLVGRPRDAIGAYREALERDPTRMDGLNGLGAAYLAAGQLKSAIVNFERAAKHLEAPTVLLNLAKAEETARRRGDALRAYERVLRIRPKEPGAVAGRRRLTAHSAKKAARRRARTRSRPATKRPSARSPRRPRKRASRTSTKPRKSQ
ncbi:MAG: tetratricopeptide repeat protein [Methanobacteriota archaeon]